MSSTRPEVLTYRNAVREGPSHGHRFWPMKLYVRFYVFFQNPKDNFLRFLSRCTRFLEHGVIWMEQASEDVWLFL